MGTKDIQFKLRFSGCLQVQGPSQVLRLANVLPQHGLLPAEGKVPHLVAASDISEIVASHSDSFPAGPLGTWWTTFNLLPDWTGYLIAGFSCIDSTEGLVSCTVSTLIDQRNADQVEPLAQRLLSLGKDLYPLAAPSLGWIDKSFANVTLTKDVKKVRLLSVSWVNFFGPAYVAKYGRDLLLGIPGHKADELPDGGIFHQLTPHFLMDDIRQARSLRKAVKEYFAKAGLKVTCQAPYVQSQIFGKEGESTITSSEDYGTLEEFQAGLAQLLRTTLLLEDGMRVKVVYLEWRKLTAEQSRLAVAMIRDTAQAELAGHPLVPIRFEFNEIPPDLNTVMDQLSQEQSRLTYERVEM